MFAIDHFIAIYSLERIKKASKIIVGLQFHLGYKDFNLCMPIAHNLNVRIDIQVHCM